MTKVFSTMDLYLAAFLSLNQLELILELRHRKVLFSFEANDSLYLAMDRYNSNERVPVADFVTTVKTLRGKMLTAKEGMRENGKGERNGCRKDF